MLETGKLQVDECGAQGQETKITLRFLALDPGVAQDFFCDR